MIGSQEPMVPVGRGLPTQLGQNHQMLENLLTSSGAHIEEEADLRKLCILGLPWDTTDEMLHSYFSQFGPLEEATIIRKAKTGESRGFGFVTYCNAADAQMVRSREHSVGGRHCDAKQALPRGTTNPNRTTRLFIGRIPHGVTDAELRDYFERFGRVQDAYIPKDPATGKQAHRGFGFVTFASADDVDKVMSCAHTLSNQELAVQCAIPKDKGGETGLNGSRPGNRWWQTASNESYPSSADSSITSMVGHWQQPYFPFTNPTAAGLPQHSGAASQIGNEPSSARPSGDFPRPSGDYGRPSADYGRPYGIEEEPQQNGTASGRLPGGILNLHGGSSSGSLDPGHIDRFVVGNGSTASNTISRRSSMELNVQRLGSNDSGQLSADQTVQALQGLTFGGGRDGIGISLALLNQARNQAVNHGQGSFSVDAAARQGFPPLSNAQQPLHLSNLSGSRPAHLNGAALKQLAQRPTYGSGAAMRTGPADANAGPRIFLGKLNKDTTEQDVKEYFTKFGYVLDVYMPRDKVKRSEHRGFGFVTFETEAAIQRIAQHGPHQIKGSVIAIDSAVPRKEEGPSSEEADDRTPSAAAHAAAAAAQAFNLNNYGRGTVISPTASAAAAFANGGLSSPNSASYAVNGLGSPSSISHPGSSPTLPSHLSTMTGQDVAGSRRVSYDHPKPSFEQQLHSSLDGYGTARNASFDRVRSTYKQY